MEGNKEREKDGWKAIRKERRMDGRKGRKEGKRE